MRAFLAFLSLALPLLVMSQPTVGITHHSLDAAEGYVLLAPMPSDTTYLIDNCGRICHKWTDTYQPGAETVLLEDGTLFRQCRTVSSWFSGGGTGGRLVKMDWDGTVLWEGFVADSVVHSHHDFEVLPSGNVLVLAWESHTEADAVANGRNPATVAGRIWSEKLMELRLIGTDSAEVVWEWRVWDHLVQQYDSLQANYGLVAAHPRRIHLNFPAGASAMDWLHINAVSYNAALDQIAVSVHKFSEIWVIDHSTSTAEAAGSTGGRYGHGGDLLYRWGNAAAYARGLAADRQFFFQHDVHWVSDSAPDSGKFIVFNNGFNRPGDDYSEVEMWMPPMDSAGWYTDPGGAAFGPAAPDWTYAAPVPTDFFSTNISGAEQMSNGNVIICEGANGRIFEINPAQDIVWEYVSPVSLAGIVAQGTVPMGNQVFRAHKYAPDYAGFAGRSLTPGDRLELAPLPLPAGCELVALQPTADALGLLAYPNPVGHALHLRWSGLPTMGLMLDASGREVMRCPVPMGDAEVDVSGLPAGLYVFTLPALGISLRVAKP